MFLKYDIRYHILLHKQFLLVLSAFHSLSLYLVLQDKDKTEIPGALEDFADTIALRDTLNEFLHSLPRDARRIFIRRYWHLHSISKIAVDFSMSESKVKSLLMRTRNKLKQHLTEGGFLHEK